LPNVEVGTMKVAVNPPVEFVLIVAGLVETSAPL
jgi:hypothetical protein